MMVYYERREKQRAFPQGLCYSISNAVSIIIIIFIIRLDK